jgi:DNA-binding MarR family transcriptional regulator
MQDIRLRDSLGHSIVRLFRVVNRAHNRALRKHKLSAEQVHILSVLWSDGPMTMGTLQRLLAVSSATLTGAIDRMEKIELVRRVPHPTDRRAMLVEATAASTRQRTKVQKTTLATEEELFGELTKSERAQLLGLIRKLCPPPD